MRASEEYRIRRRDFVSNYTHESSSGQCLTFRWFYQWPSVDRSGRRGKPRRAHRERKDRSLCAWRVVLAIPRANPSNVGRLARRKTAVLTRLALAAGAPPVPHIHRLLGTHRPRSAVMRGAFHNGSVDWRVLGDEWEIGQVDRVDLIKHVLAHRWIGGAQLLVKQSIQRIVAVEGVVLPTKVIGCRGDRGTLQRGRIIGIVGIGLLEFANVIGSRLALWQGHAKESAARLVDQGGLDADRGQVLLHDELVGFTP